MNSFRYCSNSCTSQYLKWYSTVIKTGPKNNAEVFKKTVILPKTSFQPFPISMEERDESVRKKAKFLEYYDWQRENVKGEEFVLHDGPPYANGTPHMGHAINKIYKDIILRSKLVQGLKVHFIPGWDCHGLPIELTVLKEANENLMPIEIRKKSQYLALEKIEIQKNAFKKWGILGNWDKYYYTSSPEYIVNELQLFWKLYEKGYIYYDKKPVYWSPSSRTALAEAELEYNNEHVSPAITIRFEVVNSGEPEPVYLLLWTTTPWTLPFNEAVYFSRQLEYSLVKIESLPGNYIVASVLIEHNAKKLKNKITPIRIIPHEELSAMKYRHPWRKNEVLRLFESSDVKELATGLLHCSPAHGEKDFLLGLRDGLPRDCYVDEAGCYMKEVGSNICGLNVMKEGTAYVIEELKKDILLKESFVHSYPYDWRTNEPVIIRSSKHWFINTDKLKEKAIGCLAEVAGFPDYLKDNIKMRPHWCLSRQRVWGVPIPVFFDRKLERPIVSKETIDHLCQIIKECGADSWWSFDVEQLFPQSLCNKFNVRIEDLEKGRDIMDIWFDSGISWSFVLDGKIADLYLEGVDQYRGWFQSSLLTSVAVKETAPYKCLLVHGMAVDEEGKKMSKSKGNVFDPNTAIEGKDALGVDTLRWWVASHGHHSKSPVSRRILEQNQEEIVRIKLIVKFILGSLQGFNEDILMNTRSLYSLDRYVLNVTKNTYDSIMDCYNEYKFYRVASNLLYYVTNTVSAQYVSLIKDRLYCDEQFSHRRKSCVLTLSGILDTLCHCMAPILPHLAEEVYLHHPFYSGRHLFYNKKMWAPPTSWEDESVTRSIDIANDMREQLLKTSKNTQSYSCYIEVEDDYNLLKKLNGGLEYSTDSELTELLQVASVTLSVGSRNVTLKKTNNRQCPRCRRFTAVDTELCIRCADIMEKLNGDAISIARGRINDT